MSLIREEVFIHKTADVSDDAVIGKGTKVWNQCQVRENSNIGENCILSKNVYVDFDVKIGNNVKIQNNVSVYHGVVLENGVFVGPHVCFTNDKVPRAINPDESLKSGCEWEVSKILIKKGASIGANSTIIPGITIGEWALIGAGAIVTKDVPDYGLVVGCPGKLIGYVCKCGNKFSDEKSFCEVCNVKLEDIKQ